MDAFRDHGKPRASLEEGVAEARDIVKRLAAVGIDLNEVGEELQKEGVESFAQVVRGFERGHQGPARGNRRRCARQADASRRPVTNRRSSAAFKDLDKNDFPARLWKKDATLWSKDPKEQDGNQERARPF